MTLEFAVMSVCFENKGEFLKKMTFLHCKTNKEALTVLWSVVMHAGNGWPMGLYSPLHPTLLSCSSHFLHFLQQNRAQSRLLYLSNKTHTMSLHNNVHSSHVSEVKMIIGQLSFQINPGIQGEISRFQSSR